MATLRLVYTWPDGRREVRYCRPDDHPDILEWVKRIERDGDVCPYSIEMDEKEMGK